MSARRLTILGATGSVGQSTLDVVRMSPGAFEIVGLTAHRNVEALAKAAIAFDAQAAAIADPSLYNDLRAALGGSRVKPMAGADAVNEIARMPADICMSAIVGAVGLPPTLAAIREGIDVAFANKECLVSAGHLMMQEVAQSAARLLPVDSEHNAIFQVFEEKNRKAITRLILTASGGPFRTWSAEQMAAATPAQAVAHPNWDMGAKISVDSATMMNKGLELIEAYYLFSMPSKAIDIIIHPQSVVHSMVEYSDGSVLAQLGPPDMRTPIAHALATPGRMFSPAPRLDFKVLNRLDFEEPDENRFPALRLAREALNAGASAPPILNAANEIAVAAFLDNRIGFNQIVEVVERVLNKIPPQSVEDLETVFLLDEMARAKAVEFTS